MISKALSLSLSLSLTHILPSGKWLTFYEARPKRPKKKELDHDPSNLTVVLVGENMVTKVEGFTQFVLSTSKVLTTNYIIIIQSPDQPVSISTKKVAFL